MHKKIMAALAISVILLGINNTVNAKQTRDRTLKEKIGQMLLIGFDGSEIKPNDTIVRAIENQQIGGVILFDYNFKTGTFDKNIKSPAQLKKLTSDLQHYTRTTAEQYQQEYVPLLISIDYEGGKVNRLKESYGFPKTISAAHAATLPEEDARLYANQMADTMQQMGINLDFAPVLDVNVNPENPVIGKLERSFSADPEEVARYSAIFSQAFKNHGILCAYKHFPGHGSSASDSHKGFVDVTQSWQDYELDPYKQLLNIPAGCDMVMVAHVVHYGLDSKGYPASISKPIITDLLRDKLKFDGVVITDDMQMKAITDAYGLHDAVRMAINAGSDILVFGNQLTETPQDPAQLVEMIYQDVKSGKIKQSRIEQAYQRIMKLKERLKHKSEILEH